MEFAHQWFKNPQWWFDADASTDAYITFTFGHLLDNDNDREIHDDPLSLVLVYDQLPRHVYRNTQSAHIISYYLQKALSIVDSISRVYMDCLSDEQWCFMMLPYRHTNDTNKIFQVMAASWSRVRESPVIKRFLKATYQRCPAKDQSNHLQIWSIQHNPYSLDISKTFEHILEKQNAPMCIEAPRVKSCKDMILSLSGGVDSMLCSQLCGPFSAAVHINYKNRDTSDDEEAFVRAWCHKIGLPLYVRRIHEIQRKPCMDNDMRDVYESYTRRVRYGTYATVAKLLGHAHPQIVLGHNKDDRLENIFTNIAHNNHYENLSGMEEVSWQDGICFVRPFLDLSKTTIKLLAASMSIPHLPNSTPPWSQRGQIRASIVPVIEKWDPRFLDGMFQLANNMSAMHKVMETSVSAFCKTLAQNGVVTYTQDSLPLEILFWKGVFTKITGIRPKEKALQNMQERVQHFIGNAHIHKAVIVINASTKVLLEKGKPDIDIHIRTHIAS